MTVGAVRPMRCGEYRQAGAQRVAAAEAASRNTNASGRMPGRSEGRGAHRAAGAGAHGAPRRR
ncbi:hypothetical protein DM57_12235 [Burkholderia mallei]|nr:hypothetical protein DM57_12235 [Burkholderia mallei]AOP69523.1 hypothetical protein BHL98_06725 [Burkholderia mallei]ATD91749.1 hypothetical protein NM78_22870 [Burkholderia mallei]ATE35486.1 hypothetical protein RY28_22885 [Burkholderia mallei]ATE40402.1 hypothetical protein RY29_22595 [Burkholderia mallei]